MSLFAEIKRFLVEKFWLPLVDESIHYNMFNTAAYAIGFAAAAVYIGKPLLDKLDIEVNREFAIGLTPFIFLGGAARVLEDLAIFDTMLLRTPFIYMLIFAIVAPLLGLSKLLERQFNIEYYKTLLASGLVMLLGLLLFYTTSLNSLVIPAILKSVFIIGAIVLVLHSLISYYRPDLAVAAFEIPIIAHFWDATTSYTALTLSNTTEEKHVLAGQFIEIMGPSGIFVAKALIIVPAVYFIYDGFEGENRNYYLFLVALLGLALGTRNLLSLITG